MGAEIKTGCRCGAVSFRIAGAPIASARCHCKSCRRAGALLEGLDGAVRITDEDGATPLVMFRVDRATCLKGAEHLAEHRLSPASPTRRIVAICCNTALFLDYTKGHWLSWYWRPMEATGLPHPTTDVNVDGKIPYGFLAKMILSWASIGFRVPKVDYVTRQLKVPS